MAFVQFTQPDDQPIVINTDRIVTATPLRDGPRFTSWPVRVLRIFNTTDNAVTRYP